MTTTQRLADLLAEAIHTATGQDPSKPPSRRDDVLEGVWSDYGFARAILATPSGSELARLVERADALLARAVLSAEWVGWDVTYCPFCEQTAPEHEAGCPTHTARAALRQSESRCRSCVHVIHGQDRCSAIAAGREQDEYPVQCDCWPAAAIDALRQSEDQT